MSVSDEATVERWPGEWPEIETAAFARLAGHHPAWIGALQQGLGHRVYVIRVGDSANCRGVLPLVFVRGPIFGKFLVSLPYLNTGGVWAADDAVAGQLIDAACELADELDVKYLECRHEQPAGHPKFNFERTDKVHMRLALPASDEELDKSFKSKLRSQVKKSNQYDSTVQFGGLELLSDFYEVFAHNMRDLGTPVFSKKLFSSILEHFKGTPSFVSCEMTLNRSREGCSYTAGAFRRCPARAVCVSSIERGQIC